MTTSQDPLDPELHAHSPIRPSGPQKTLPDLSRAPSAQSNTSFMGPPPIPNFVKPVQRSAGWGSDSKMPDPFVVPSRASHQSHQSHQSYQSHQSQHSQQSQQSQQRSDQSMPDYPTDADPERITSSRDTTGLFAPQPASKTFPPRDQFDEVIHIIDSPTHPPTGLQPPSNTRESSADRQAGRAASLHANQPYIVKDLYSMPGGVALIDSAGRQGSDVTMKSQSSESSEKAAGLTSNKAYCVPTGNIKGKKEGSSPRRETPPVGSKNAESSLGPYEEFGNEDARSKQLSEGKRKRENNGARKVTMTDHLELPSPRKVSKLIDEGSPKVDGIRPRQATASTRQPPGTLGNI
jgi:hypothetical protein